MKVFPKQIIRILAVAVFLTACNGAKKMTKKGDKLAEAGLHDQAFEYYHQALNKKPTYLKALTGLKNSSQIVLDNHLQDFFRAKNERNHKQVVYSYDHARKCVDTSAKHGIKLNLPAHYKNDYDASLSIYLDQQYTEAQKLLDKELFAEAQVIFEEIMQFDASYKDVGQLHQYSSKEPIYRDGKKAMRREKYRTAYAIFSRITDYKDGEKLQQEALEQASFPIAFVPDKDSRYPGTFNNVQSTIINMLQQEKNPFIKILDRSRTKYLLEEQHFSLSNAASSNNAINAGELLGAKALLIGKIVRINQSYNKVRSELKKAYEAQQIRVYDKETDLYKNQTKYNKVHYKEKKGSSSYRLVYSYQLISTETGEVLLSDVIEMQHDDAVHYAEYEGNESKLFPGRWKDKSRSYKSDVIYKETERTTPFRQLFNNSKRLKDIDQLKTDVIFDISSEVSSQIANYNPES